MEYSGIVKKNLRDYHVLGLWMGFPGGAVLKRADGDGVQAFLPFWTARVPLRPSIVPGTRSQIGTADGFRKSSLANSSSLTISTERDRILVRKARKRTIFFMPSISAWIVRMFGAAGRSSDR